MGKGLKGMTFSSNNGHKWEAPGEVWLKVLLALGVLLEYFTMSLLSCIPGVIKKLKLKQLYVHCKPPESAAITMKG